MVHARSRRRYLVLVGAIVVGGLTLLPLMTRQAAADTDAGPHFLPGKTFVDHPPLQSKGPDDITLLSTDGVDDGHAVIWTAYQNGIGPTGTPSSTGPDSTVAGYDAHAGTLVETIKVKGKVDGLRADPDHHRLLATDNEDANSSFSVINPESGSVTTYKYSPNPEESGNGGTDSISVWHDEIFIAHSNPNDTEEAAVYRVSLNATTLTAKLSSVFFDDSSASDAVSGQRSPLALTDPDTTAVVPDAAPRFGGQLMLISQGDGQMIFVSSDSDPSLHVLNLADDPTTAFPTGEPNPPVDGFAVATEESGWLYVVDNAGGPSGTGSITKLKTDGWPRGTVFVSEANDTGNQLIGTLNLKTGEIASLGNTFNNPKELLFVPADD